MTKAELKYLSEFEQNFKTAIYSNYTRNIVKSKLEKMLEIYVKETGRDYNLCTHCSSSILSFLKLIGKVYFDAVQEGLETKLEDSEIQKPVAKMENKIKKTKSINVKHKSST